MLIMMMIFTLFMLIPMLIFMINNMLTMKLKKNREKNSPFECGFDQITSPKLPFSIQFFLISLMFLIFDTEIILILPIIKLLNNMNNMTIYTFTTFITILLLSLWYEWYKNFFMWI